MVAPVTKAPPRPGGRPSPSATQRSAMSSSLAAAGDITASATFWSQAAVSQAAAVAMGSVPPVTNPKYRGPAVATVAGEPTSSSSASTSAGSRPDAGSGTSSRPRAATASGPGATRRSASPAR